MRVNGVECREAGSADVCVRVCARVCIWHAAVRVHGIDCGCPNGCCCCCVVHIFPGPFALFPCRSRCCGATTPAHRW